ncbi:MAG: hypothetical protein KAS04_00700 [Candidatus Aenigmarchaeota archaeon]|nr:hypothetical protein [Candidatus Aenigmarchaeota archaeon]
MIEETKKLPFCECGCGNHVKHSWNRFINGHQQRCPSDERKKKISETLTGKMCGEKHHMFGKKHSDETIRKMSEIKKGKLVSEETKHKMSKSLMGKNKGKKRSAESRRKMSESQRNKVISEEGLRRIAEGNKGKNLGRKHSEEAKKKMSKAQTGEKSHMFEKHLSEDQKRKISEAQKGEKNHNWKGGYSLEPYCQKFTYKLKEKIREKYNRRCFLCNKNEKGNGNNNNNRKLSVHHIDYNKMQGCDEHEWKLVPLCGNCHGKINGNTKYWENLILDILKFAWNE